MLRCPCSTPWPPPSIFRAEISDGFDGAARAVLASQPAWHSVVLFTPEGRQLLNTRLPFGALLPTTGNPEMVAQVARTQRPIVSNVFTGSIGNRPLVMLVAVPVVRDGAAEYVLGAGFDLDALTGVLSQQHLPPDTIGTLLDRNKVIIGRTQAADRFVGQPATADLAAKTGRDRGGRVPASHEGRVSRCMPPSAGLRGRVGRSPWACLKARRMLHCATRSGSFCWSAVAPRFSALCSPPSGPGAIAQPIASLSTAARDPVARRPHSAGESAHRAKWNAVDAGHGEKPARSSGASEAATSALAAGLFRESERRRRAAEALAEVGQLISNSLDPLEVSQRIVDHLRALLSSCAAALYRLEPHTEELVALAASGTSVGLPSMRGTVMPAFVGAVGLAVRERQGMVSADVLADPRVLVTSEFRAQVEAAGYRAVLAVPLMVHGRVIGALGVGDQAGRAFDAEDIRTAGAFADQAAIAIENARLHAETNERLIQSETLLSVSSQVSGMLDVTEVMRRVAREACQALGADMVGAFLADADHTCLRPIAGYHVPPTSPSRS